VASPTTVRRTRCDWFGIAMIRKLLPLPLQALFRMPVFRNPKERPRRGSLPHSCAILYPAGTRETS
jgi:hypothetical protein